MRGSAESNDDRLDPNQHSAIEIDPNVAGEHEEEVRGSRGIEPRSPGSKPGILPLKYDPNEAGEPENTKRKCGITRNNHDRLDPNQAFCH